MRATQYLNEKQKHDSSAYCLAFWYSLLDFVGFLAVNALTFSELHYQFLPAQRCYRGISYGRVPVSVSVCLSVCLFVTSQYCIETAERIQLAFDTRLPLTRP